MQRQKNFSKAEKECLLDLILVQRNAIESKESNHVTNVKKDEAWADITTIYNANIRNVQQSEKALRNCWDNMKETARKYCAAVKRAKYMTGGGIANVQTDDLLERVTEIMGETATYGLVNPFDSDSIAKKENIEHELPVENEDENENNPEEVFAYLMKNEEINSWKSWNPGQLKSQISRPLQNESDMQTSSSDSLCKKKRYSSHYYPKKTLTEAKTELANTLKINVQEKNDYEKQILEAQLEKEKLKIELLKILIGKEKETKISGEKRPIFRL